MKLVRTIAAVANMAPRSYFLSILSIASYSIVMLSSKRKIICSASIILHLFRLSIVDYISSPRPQNPINKNFDPSHLYAKPSKSASRSNQGNCQPEPSTSSSFTTANHNLPKISNLGGMFKNSTHSASQESNNSHSDHSGASGVTLPLDEPIEYADA